MVTMEPGQRGPTPAGTSSRLPDLLIRSGDVAYTASAADGSITIGREPPARIQLGDQRISKSHARIEPTADHWTIIDTRSTNGMFLDGRRIRAVTISDGMTIHLGHPSGQPMTFAFGATPKPPSSPSGDAARSAEIDDVADDEIDETADTGETAKPDWLRVGKMIEKERKDRGKSQRDLQAMGVIGQSSLVKLENGRHWPKAKTLAKLEEFLEWPIGTLTRMRDGAPSPARMGSEVTQVLSNTVQLAVATDLAEMALGGLKAQIESLGAVPDSDFGRRARPLLADLRRLESRTANAARAARGAADVAMILSDVRRTYKDLMLRAARAPGATLGQRTYAARHRAELTLDETAQAAGVDIDVVASAEAEQPVDATSAAALEALIARLSRH